MKNIYLIAGPSGVGKTTVVQELCKRYGYKEVVSYTDRKPRYPGEPGHVFLFPEEFNRLPKLCAYTEFAGYRYGVTEDVINDCDLFVIDPDGIEYLKASYQGPKGLVVFGLVANETVLRARMKKRGDSPEQIQNRIEHDREAFRELGKISDQLIHATTVDGVVNLIHELIQEHELIKGSLYPHS